MEKKKDVTIEKKARISALLGTREFSQREAAQKEGVSHQTLLRIAKLIKENIPNTSSSR